MPYYYGQSKGTNELILEVEYMGSEPQTFEQAIARLEEVVRELESGQLELDRALELFAEGINLSKYCNLCLEKAEHKISILMADGELAEAPSALTGGGR